MSDERTCSRCGAKLSTHTPGGHCLKCLLELGLEQKTAVISLTEKSGDRIGQYKLLEQIGEGGCGIVYLAEQEQPVRRQLALKIIKLGMDTKQVIARFEAERQALALMEHLNIARVFDAGATDAGRPYFVMELVRGSKITDYCDAHRLTIRQRLDLFVQVCQAVQHAHQKGVIHRDLKPSNILVTEQDGKAVPKIIDFGIAKATTDQRLTDKTLFTAFEKFIGTPAYMSPEQASLGGMDVDTRSDIYSLGVLLYELLCGQPPFDAATLQGVALEEVLTIIRKSEPARPAARVANLTTEDATEVAKRRQSDPVKLPSLLRGELDWIVMKALEKDRSRRYSTANGFALDIERFLNNEAVTARPPSFGYRVQKTIVRNKAAVAAALVLFAVLATGIATTSLQAVRARHAEKAALQQKTAAEDAARKSKQLVFFFQDMLLFTTVAGGPYADKMTVADLLDRGAGQMSILNNEPDVLASVQFSVGYCYSKCGKWDKAVPLLKSAFQIQEHLKGLHDSETLITGSELASALLSSGNRREGIEQCKRVQMGAHEAANNPSVTDDDRDAFWHCEVMVTRELVQAYLLNGDAEQARPLVEKLLEAVNANKITDYEAGHIWEGMGEIDLMENRPNDALQAFEKSAPFYTEKMIVQNAWLHGLQGAAWMALKDYQKAEPLMTNELSVLEQRFGNTHFRVQRAYHDLVTLYTQTGRTNEAAIFTQKLIPK